jgi:hypothetical protein
LKESRFDSLAKEIIIQTIPGCLNELDETGLSNPDVSLEQLISAAKTTAGVPAGYALIFAKELLKKVLLEEAIIEKD